MSERKDEKWLDTQLQRAVEGTTPVFDAQAWKQKHSNEYRILLSRAHEGNRPASNARRTVWVVLGGWVGRLAVAAAIAVAVGLFVIGRNGHEPAIPPGPAAQASPASMMSMMSLRTAYQQGGFEALDRQLRDTLDEFGPRSPSVPLRDLVNM